jgi:hypothetical protein
VPLLGAIPEDQQVCSGAGRGGGSSSQGRPATRRGPLIAAGGAWVAHAPRTAATPCARAGAGASAAVLTVPRARGVRQVIIATNQGEPLVLQKKLSLSGIAFENSARRLIGKQVRTRARGGGPPPSPGPHPSFQRAEGLRRSSP